MKKTTITNVTLVFITQGKIGKNKQEKQSYPKKNWNKGRLPCCFILLIL